MSPFFFAFFLALSIGYWLLAIGYWRYSHIGSWFLASGS